jgi:hypothetical protein
VKRRDAYILSALGVIALVFGFWTQVLSPKREELSKVDDRVDEQEQSLTAARAEAQQFAQARHQFPRAYATVVRLGKAAPADLDMPSLVVQLADAGRRSGVGFRKVALSTSAGAGSGGTSGAGTSAPAPQQPAAPAQPSGTTGATGPTGPAAAPPPGTPAPANAQTAATLPIGASVGEAGLPVLKLSLVYQGNFFRMGHLITRVQRLVQKHGDRLRVRGRLVTIDGFSVGKGDGGFPQVKVNFAATAYLVPESQGLLAGATAGGPASTGVPAPTPVSGTPGGITSPPTAVVAP